ncbi:MAG: hypothetical protein K8R46_08705 [Pirellulales bacterium]|nr:hypothetical protein [Pirellulales bacterium]
MRYRIVGGFCGFLVLSICLAGCGPELSERDLGTVVDEMPKVAGSEKPYPMPQLGPSSEDEETKHR